jgi:TonB family protein
MARTIFVMLLAAGLFATGAAPAQNLPVAQTDVTIVSDTHGYDFGPYVNYALNRIRTNWYALIPVEARQGQSGRVVVVFNIDRDGKVAQLRVTGSSDVESFDQASRGAVSASEPFQKLPAGFDGDVLSLRLVFSYNNRAK